MRIFSVGYRYRLISRVRVTVWVLLKHGLGYFADRILKEPYLRLFRWRKPALASAVRRASLPERLRLVLEELGPTYIKVGQFFSTRADLLPEEYLKELSKLQDSVPAFPFKDVSSIIREEFGKSESEIFSSIDETPMFSASIAQVHRAVLTDGRQCVIKVQRPGISALIERDIEVIKEMGKLASRHIPELKNWNISEILSEFGEHLKQQLDFLHEAGMMKKLRSYFTDSGITVPLVIWEYTTNRIITMEQISGVKITESAAGCDVTKEIVRALFRVLFETGYFHGDLHPGNILITDSVKIGLVDFGLVGYLPFSRRKELAFIVSGTLRGNIEQVLPSLKKFFGIPQKTPASFEKEVNFILDKYSSLPLNRVNLGYLIKDLLAIARKLQLKVDPEIGLLGKTLAGLESICMAVDPSINLLELSKAYWEPLLKKGIFQHIWLEDARNTLVDYAEMLRNFPKEWEEFLRSSHERVELEREMIRKFARYEKSIEIAGMRISTGLILLPVIAIAIAFGVQFLPPKLFVLLAVGLVLLIFSLFHFVARKWND